MARFFNTAGPCIERIHYTLNPLASLKNVRQLVDGERYFILSAPRQTGKTTTILTLMVSHRNK